MDDLSSTDRVSFVMSVEDRKYYRDLVSRYNVAVSNRFVFQAGRLEKQIRQIERKYGIIPPDELAEAYGANVKEGE